MKKITSSKGVFEINYDSRNANSKGEVYIICPICTPGRKPEHQNDKKLAVNISKDPTPWRCNHCGEAGYILTKEYIERAKIKPLTVNYNYLKINDQLAAWFWEKRCIGIETLNHFDITMSEEPILQQRVKPGQESLKGTWVTKKCINYKYKENNILVNIKFRDNIKNFKLISGATLIFYNLDSIKDSKEAVIVEGENDCLAYHESGIKNVISVPNGATITEKERDIYKKTGNFQIISSINMEYLDLSIDDLAHIEMFYIATDDDPPGIKLREELARRLGYERCKYIKFGEYKDDKDQPINDPNELLIKRGKATLAGTLNTARVFPIADVTFADEYVDKILKNYDEGKTKGISTLYKSLDPHFTWVKGWLYVINGFPNMGKTSFMLNLMTIASVMYQWKWGIYCPENYPVENVIEIISMILIGKTTDPDYDNRMQKSELEDVVRTFIKNHFYFVDNEDGFTPEKLREIKKRLIKQHGIVGFLTDPWTSLNHDVQAYGGIDQYLEKELNHEIRLTTKYNLINLICHHPKTPKSKQDVIAPPSVFELTGGKFWWIKVYSATCIHQEDFADWKNNLVGFHVQKVKDKQKAGETTSPNNYPILRYDKLSRRFYEAENPDSESPKYKRFPFDTYLSGEQKTLFEGF